MKPPEHHEDESYPPLHIPVCLLVRVLGQRVASHSQAPSHSPSVMCSDCLTQMCFIGSRDKLMACGCQRCTATILLLLPLLFPVLIPSPSIVILSFHQLSVLLTQLYSKTVQLTNLMRMASFWPGYSSAP